VNGYPISGTEAVFTFSAYCPSKRAKLELRREDEIAGRYAPAQLQSPEMAGTTDAAPFSNAPSR